MGRDAGGGGQSGHFVPPVFRLSTYFVLSFFSQTGVTHRRFQCIAIALAALPRAAPDCNSPPPTHCPDM